jgi:AraC-like DNA-binding protein
MQLFLSLSGIILSAILIYFNARNNKSTIYLGILFWLASMNSFTYYALLYSGSITLTAIVLENTGIIPLLGGPILYFYIRSVLNDDPHLKKQDLWHLVPVLIYLATTSPYLLSSWTYKTEVAGVFISELNSQNHFNTAFLGNKFLVYIVFILSKVFFLAYVLWSTGLLISFLRNKRAQEVFFRLQPTLRWIKAFLYILIILVIAHILFMIKIFAFGDLTSFANIKTIQNILAAGPIAIILYTFFTPEVLYGLPRIPASRKEIKLVDKPTNMHNHVKKTTQKQIESNYLQSIGREADGCMEKFRPYTQPDFNLAKLSVLIHIPVHHLAYYLREEKKKSFTDYRNEWRVRHAKNLMKEGKNSEITLEALGLLSGFPNRDSFREAFHRIEGVTPAVFVAQSKE